MGDLYEAYRYAIATAMELYPLVYPRRDEELQLPGRPGAEASYQNGVVKYVVWEIPPLLKSHDKLHRKLKQLWGELIGYAHAKAKITAKFDRALCIIKIYHPTYALWDVDNRAYGHIINAIRATKIIPDDSSIHLSVMLTGKSGVVEPKTEIYVVDWDQVAGKFRELGIELQDMD